MGEHKGNTGKSTKISTKIYVIFVVTPPRSACGETPSGCDFFGGDGWRARDTYCMYQFTTQAKIKKIKVVVNLDSYLGFWS